MNNDEFQCRIEQWIEDEENDLKTSQVTYAQIQDYLKG